MIVGVVLAAGAGRRMGGPKALIGPLALPGVSPLERVCGWVHDAGCPRVVAVVGAEADAVRAALPARGWLTVVEASDWETGMGASLRAGLAAASGLGADAVLVTLVDLPDVRTPVYRRVLDAAGAAPDTLARACYGGRPGHPVLIGRAHLAAAAAGAIGDRGARALFAATEHALVECGDLATGADADRPAP